MSKKEKKEKKEINRMYQLYELKDTIISAIDNMKQVIKQNGLLVECILNHQNKEQLKDLVQSLTNDCKHYIKKIDIYTGRLEKLDYILSIYEKKDDQSEFTKTLVNKLIEGFGLDEPIENYPTKV